MNQIENVSVNALTEIVEFITENADELLLDGKDDFSAGQLLAYMSALAIIKESLPEIAPVLGLDYDLEAKYLGAMAGKV
jgi:hypothetical protein